MLLADGHGSKEGKLFWMYLIEDWRIFIPWATRKLMEEIASLVSVAVTPYVDLNSGYKAIIWTKINIFVYKNIHPFVSLRIEYSEIFRQREGYWVHESSSRIQENAKILDGTTNFS